MSNVLGLAFSDYYFNTSPDKLWIHNKYGRRENMPVEIYFRKAEDMPELELVALKKCRGKVLDIGAGVGSHALELQKRGISVTALEISRKACTIMRKRGVYDIVCKDIYDFEARQFDTLLLLMNGIGLTGTIAKLRLFLQHVKLLTNPGGQLLFDSSDVAYVYNGSIPVMPDYYGEIMYQYQYKDKKSSWFKWLYIDRKLLKKIAAEEGWKTRIVSEDISGQYLAQLVRKNG